MFTIIIIIIIIYRAEGKKNSHVKNVSILQFEQKMKPVAGETKKYNLNWPTVKNHLRLHEYLLLILKLPPPNAKKKKLNFS